MLINGAVKSNLRSLGYFGLKSKDLPRIGIYDGNSDMKWLLPEGEISTERVRDFCQSFLNGELQVSGHWSWVNIGFLSYSHSSAEKKSFFLFFYLRSTISTILAPVFPKTFPYFFSWAVYCKMLSLILNYTFHNIICVSLVKEPISLTLIQITQNNMTTQWCFTVLQSFFDYADFNPYNSQWHYCHRHRMP